jgi:hypothetical protein
MARLQQMSALSRAKLITHLTSSLSIPQIVRSRNALLVSELHLEALSESSEALRHNQHMRLSPTYMEYMELGIYVPTDSIMSISSLSMSAGICNMRKGCCVRESGNKSRSRVLV